MIKPIFKSKKIIAVFSILILGALVLSANAATWQIIDSGTNSGLQDVYFVDTNTGWAVGSSGVIRKTTNGGTTWIAQTSGTSQDLNSIYFVDANNGWFAGTLGVLRKTTDGGATWMAQTSGTKQLDVNLRAVFFVNTNTGWVVGESGTIRKTTDGGTTWIAQTSGVGKNLTSVHFTDVNNGWVTGNTGTILKTTNGGTTWTAQISKTTEDIGKVKSIYLNVNTAWAVGNTGTILKTTDGGTTWTAQISGTSENLTSVHFTDVNNGWVTGNTGTILKTTNGGTNWLTDDSGTAYNLNSVFFTDTINGWAVGFKGTIRKHFVPALSCSVTTSAGCSGTVIWRMSGATNAHAELPGQTTVTYDNNVVCCTGGVAGLGNSCSGTYATPLKLSGLTNAHVQKNNVDSYVNSACISVPFGNGVSVGYVTSPATCFGSGYNTTLGSMTAINNSHVGNADWTQGIIKICATVAVAPVVSISINDGIVTYGTVAAGASKTTIDLNDTQILTNTGNVTEMFNIKGQNTACPWTLASTAGINQYAHQFCKKTDVSCANPPTNYTALTSNYQTLYTNVVSTGSKQFDLRLTMPTASSCFTSQSVDVIIQAVQQ